MNILTFAVEPIRLLTDQPQSSTESGSLLMWILLGAGVLCIGLFLVSLVAFLAPRLTLTRNPEERVFRVMSRKLRLGRTHRTTLRRLASLAEAPPIALVLCRSVFSRSISLADADASADSEGGPAARGHLLELEHRLFG